MQKITTMFSLRGHYSVEGTSFSLSSHSHCDEVVGGGREERASSYREGGQRDAR